MMNLLSTVVLSLAMFATGPNDTACHGVADPCVAAWSYDPAVDFPANVIAGPELVKTAIDAAPKLVDWELERGATIEYNTRRRRFELSKISTGRETTPEDGYDGQLVVIWPTDKTVATIHSHPGSPYYNVVPSCIGPGAGDHMAVEGGFPSFVVRHNVVAVFERVNGQYRIRYVKGTPSMSERYYMAQSVNCAQMDSRSRGR